MDNIFKLIHVTPHWDQIQKDGVLLRNVPYIESHRDNIGHTDGVIYTSLIWDGIEPFSIIKSCIDHAYFKVKGKPIIEVIQKLAYPAYLYINIDTLARYTKVDKYNRFTILGKSISNYEVKSENKKTHIQSSELYGMGGSFNGFYSHIEQMYLYDKDIPIDELVVLGEIYFDYCHEDTIAEPKSILIFETFFDFFKKNFSEEVFYTSMLNIYGRTIPNIYKIYKRIGATKVDREGLDSIDPFYDYNEMLEDAYTKYKRG